MEATATAADFRESGGFWERIKGGARKFWDSVKRVGRYMWNLPRRGFHAIGGTKEEPNKLRRGLRVIGRGIVKGMSFVGIAVFSFVQAMAMSVRILVAVPLLIVALAALLVAAILTFIVTGICRFVSVVINFFRWIFNERRPYAALYGSDEKSTFRDYLADAHENWVSTWMEIRDATRERFGRFGTDATDDDGDIVVTTESINDVPRNDKDVVVLDVLKDKAALQVQADIDDITKAYPGALVANTDNPGAPHDDHQTWLSPLNPTLDRIGRWIGKNPDRAAVDYRFIGIEYDELDEALTQLRNTANTKSERSYWQGRLRALDQANRRPMVVQEHGRAWALVFMEMKSQQREWDLTKVRCGFMDMMHDLNTKSTRQGSQQLDSV